MRRIFADLHRRKSLVEVGDDVLGSLDAAAQADKIEAFRGRMAVTAYKRLAKGCCELGCHASLSRECCMQGA